MGWLLVLGHALGVHLTSIQDLRTVWFWKHGVMQALGSVLLMLTVALSGSSP